MVMEKKEAHRSEIFNSQSTPTTACQYNIATEQAFTSATDIDHWLPLSIPLLFLVVGMVGAELAEVSGWRHFLNNSFPLSQKM